MLHFFWCGYFLTEASYQNYESANLEIAKWAEHYLGQKTAFHQSSWLAGKVTENPQDILIGHPTWYNQFKFVPQLLRNWVKDNALDPSQECHPNTYILMPWIPNFTSEWTPNMPFWQKQLLTARKIFGLGGGNLARKDF